MGTALRWTWIPIASVIAWYVALFLGIVLLSIATSIATYFCPESEMISDTCVAPWFRVVEAGIFCFSTALSAVFVITAAVLVAPAAKALIAWLAFAIGSIVALIFALGTWAWGMFASAVIAGLFTAFILARFQKRAAAKNKIVEDEIDSQDPALMR
jgi:hypothetical protein